MDSTYSLSRYLRDFVELAGHGRVDVWSPPGGLRRAINPTVTDA